MSLRSLTDWSTVYLMLNSVTRNWTIASVVTAFIVTWMPLSAALAEPPQRARKDADVREELERLERERFQEKLRQAREKDRVREAERARRTREEEERRAEAAERAREANENARVREAQEAESMQAAREADRARTGKRSRGQRDKHLPAPPSR